MVSWADRDVVVVKPEADLVARFDAEFITKLLRDDDLSLRPDSMSHTYQYNHVDVSCVTAVPWLRGSPEDSALRWKPEMSA